MIPAANLNQPSLNQPSLNQPSLNQPSLNQLWATLLIEELVRNGVDTYCIAPGSRSAPLTVAVARHLRANGIVHYDERGAAFHALGYGRATGMPAAVITTSGSALANVWPAVVEASADHVPLLVLSGDRPPELLDTGAHQTMDQVKFFGGFARWSTNLPCPSASIDPAMVLTAVDQAVSRCRGPARDAVHINCMFREPLAPTGQRERYDRYLEPIRAWCDGDRPYTRYENAVVRPERELLVEVAELATHQPRGIVVAGRLADPAQRRLRNAGCRAVKLKVGTRTIAQDVDLTRRVRDAVGSDMALRLDANRSWSLAQAVEFGRDIGDAGVEYPEEPVADPAVLVEFFDATGIQVALDESLLERRPDDLDECRAVGAVILKPTLLGGIGRAGEWAARAQSVNIRPVVSGCFESGVGLLALAEFAWSLTRDAVPAGLDTYRWLAADVVRPRIPVEPGAISWNATRARRHRIDMARLRERSNG